jgi:molecular chaperone GrpE
MPKNKPDHVEEELLETEEVTPDEINETQTTESVEMTKEEEYLNDLKRLQADFDNYKKRQAEAEKNLKDYLIQGLVLDIIPVLDNFNAATQHVPEAEKSSPWVVGIQYIEKQLADVLAERGVQALVPTIGEAFDPSKHEAIESETPEGEDTQNIISQVKQKGYQLGERIIRPAKVSIK